MNEYENENNSTTPEEAQPAEPVAEPTAPSPEPEAPAEPQPQPQQPPYGYQPPQPPYPPYQYPPQYAYNQPQTMRPKKKRTGLKVFCVLLAIVILFSGIGIAVAVVRSDRSSKGFTSGADGTTVNSDGPSLDIADTPENNPGNAASGSVLTAAQVAAKGKQSLVGILVYQNNQLYTEGSGIIMGVDSAKEYTYIVTCAHLLDTKGITAAIQLEDGTRHDAEIVGYDARTDLGVIKVKETGFKAAEFGDSDKLIVGEAVYAIGNPGGTEFYGSFTNGMVSALGRVITSEVGYDLVCVQHTAAISPGNSGGALLNEYGQVIGINSAKIADSNYEGMGFAIPITQAKPIIDSIIANGYVPGRPMLGIKYLANDSSNLNSIYAMAVKMKGLPAGSLVIYSIDAVSDLRNTDAQAGDMITAVNGKKLDTADVLLEEVQNSKVGNTLTLSIARIDSRTYELKTFDIKVKLIEENSSTYTEEETTKSYQYSDDFNNYFGW